MARELFEVSCPCCNSTLKIDSEIRAVIAHEEPVKKPVTMRVDADVLAWFQRGGRGYQTRINRALRKVMMEERKKPRE